MIQLYHLVSPICIFARLIIQGCKDNGCTKGSLVQRELSAQLTEGLKPPLCKGRGTALAVEGLLHSKIYILANSGEIATHLIIGNPQDTNTVLFKVSCSFRIVFHALIFIMLRSIQFHDQLCFGTVKVYDVFAENLLIIEYPI